MKELHKVKISKDEKGMNHFFIDDKEIKTALMVNVRLNGGQNPKVIFLINADVELETDADIEKIINKK